MASISIIQFKNEAKDYHQERLDRKEFAIKEHINYVLSTTTYPLTPDNLKLIFKDKIHELSDIHNLEINIYSLEGKLVKSVQFYSKDGLHYESSVIDLVDGMYRIQNAEVGFTLALIIQN